MRIKVEIELRRPARRSVALLLGVLLLAVPAVALAGHQFNDVPNGHPFHDQIAAIAEAGITAGFPDGGYHPGDPVTRQAMAAFMQRGLGRVGLAIGEAPMTATVSVAAGSAFALAVPVRQLTITVPGASSAFGPQQLVHLQGRVAFYTSMSDSDKGCPCAFYAFIHDMTNKTTSIFQYQTFESASPISYYHSFDVEALFAVPPGQVSYQLELGLVGRDNITNPATFHMDASSSLSAMTFPFGPTGTSDL
jgi:S-layer family protein